jgi:hypothetical protein
MDKEMHRLSVGSEVGGGVSGIEKLSSKPKRKAH